MSVLNHLNWRYATKRMNGEKVPAEKIEKILDAIQLAPTSIGLQPFTVLVIDDVSTRAKLAPAINNQPQITEGSHVLVFAAWTKFDRESIDKHLNHIADLRGIEVESLSGLRTMIENAVTRKTPEQLLNWFSRQAYIALGTGLIAAAEEKVDATPMEGFDAEELDRLLGLQEKDLHSTVIMTLGYRDSDKDYLSKAPKVRRKKDELFIRI